jgi:hypothetical protein
MTSLLLEQPLRAGYAAPHRVAWTQSERWVMGWLAFFIVVAYAVELPWLLSSVDLPRLDNAWGRFWAVYGQADRGYYDRVSGFERGLESFHIFVTQWMHLGLLWAVKRRWAWRHVLQIAVGSYVAYSTVVYLAAKHLTGYALMPEHDAAAFLTLYLANLPWVLGNLYIAVDGGRELLRLIAASGGSR